MTYELYINNVLCDLPSDGEITLVYNSPIFANLDAIKSNGSYNIDLPITVSNRRAMQNAQRPDTGSRAPYQKLPAKLYIDGIDIFTNGYAVITEITDTISVTLVWGNIDLFTKMYDTELRDLKDSFKKWGLGSILWNSKTQWSDVPGKQFAFYRADFNGVGIRLYVDPTTTPDPAPYVKPAYIHPSVSVKELILAIMDHTGVSLEFPEGCNPRQDNLYLPLISENGDPDFQSPAITVKNVDFYKNDGSSSGGCFEIKSAINNTNKEITTAEWHISFVDISGMSSFSIKIDGLSFEIDCNIATVDVPLLKYWYFYVWGSKDTSADGVRNAQLLARANCYGDIVTESASYVRLRLLLSSSFTVNGKDYDYNYVFFQLTPSTEIVSLQFAASVRWNIAFDSDEFELKANFPTKYPLAVNLPDMSCGDFLQNLMNMYGLFGGIVDSSSNTIRFITVDEIYGNIEEGAIYDWSRKVLCNERRDPTMAEAMEYSIDDWAQKNILDYSNDKDVSDDTSGKILIDNKNIDDDKEIEIDFSAARNRAYPAFWGNEDYKINVARVPIFGQNGDSVDNTSCTDRILQLMTDNYTDSSGTEHTIPYLTFPDWLKFGGKNGIVAKRYAALQRLLTDMKIISVRMKLSPLDLRGLDFAVPVFLDTFGAYFAIYTITVASSGVCECKLIKM